MLAQQGQVAEALNTHIASEARCVPASDVACWVLPLVIMPAARLAGQGMLFKPTTHNCNTNTTCYRCCRLQRCAVRGSRLAHMLLDRAALLGSMGLGLDAAALQQQALDALRQEAASLGLEEMKVRVALLLGILLVGEGLHTQRQVGAVHAHAPRAQLAATMGKAPCSALVAGSHNV